MKLNRLETHDRLTHFVKQEFDIGNMCQNIINQRPFGDHGFYIYAHTRTLGMDEKVAIFNEDMMMSIKDRFYKRAYQSLADVPEKRLIWQPRLTKPKASTNSMLFKAYPGSDNVKVIWMIPAPELWEQYEKGKMMENEIISESIYKFKNRKKELESVEDDDLNDAQIDAIYREISQKAKPQPKLANLKPANVEASSTSI